MNYAWRTRPTSGQNTYSSDRNGTYGGSSLSFMPTSSLVSPSIPQRYTSQGKAEKINATSPYYNKRPQSPSNIQTCWSGSGQTSQMQKMNINSVGNSFSTNLSGQSYGNGTGRMQSMQMNPMNPESPGIGYQINRPNGMQPMGSNKSQYFPGSMTQQAQPMTITGNGSFGSVTQSMASSGQAQQPQTMTSSKPGNYYSQMQPMTNVESNKNYAMQNGQNPNPHCSSINYPRPQTPTGCNDNAEVQSTGANSAQNPNGNQQGIGNFQSQTSTQQQQTPPMSIGNYQALNSVRQQQQMTATNNYQFQNSLSPSQQISGNNFHLQGNSFVKMPVGQYYAPAQNQENSQPQRSSQPPQCPQSSMSPSNSMGPSTTTSGSASASQGQMTCMNSMLMGNAGNNFPSHCTANNGNGMNHMSQMQKMNSHGPISSQTSQISGIRMFPESSTNTNHNHASGSNGSKPMHLQMSQTNGNNQSMSSLGSLGGNVHLTKDQYQFYMHQQRTSNCNAGDSCSGGVSMNPSTFPNQNLMQSSATSTTPPVQTIRVGAPSQGQALELQTIRVAAPQMGASQSQDQRLTSQSAMMKMGGPSGSAYPNYDLQGAGRACGQVTMQKGGENGDTEDDGGDNEGKVKYIPMSWGELLGGGKDGGLEGLKVIMAAPPSADAPNQNRQLRVAFGNQPVVAQPGETPLKVLSISPVEGYKMGPLAELEDDQSEQSQAQVQAVQQQQQQHHQQQQNHQLGSLRPPPMMSHPMQMGDIQIQTQMNQSRITGINNQIPISIQPTSTSSPGMLMTSNAMRIQNPIMFSPNSSSSVMKRSDYAGTKFY